jgi:hypothetical protein
MNSQITLTTAASALLIGAVTAAFAQAIPSWNLGSHEWVCSQMCQEGKQGRPVRVEQNGKNFIFGVPEIGTTANGVFESGYTVQVTTWHNTAVFSPDLRTVTFSNGTVWARK